MGDIPPARGWFMERFCPMPRSRLSEVWGFLIRDVADKGKGGPGFALVPFHNSTNDGTTTISLMGGGEKRRMATKKKKETVKELNNLFQESQVLIFTDYRGLTVSDITNLRRQLR